MEVLVICIVCLTPLRKYTNMMNDPFSYRVSLRRLRATGPLGFLCQRRAKPQGLVHRVHFVSTGFRK